MRRIRIYTAAMHTTTHQPSAGVLAPASTRPPVAPRAVPVRRLTSEAVLDGEKEIVIDHHGAEYRLRLTSLGKLILTK